MFPQNIRVIENRFPRLLRLVMFTACLSPTEAAACLRDFKSGNQYSSEAVNHYGGTHAVMKRAMQIRANYNVVTWYYVGQK